MYADLRAGVLKLLYVAPERLSGEAFLDRIRRVKISLLAIDKAHCISEWGHNFRPEYLRLACVAEELALRPVLALTATQRHVHTSFYRKNLHLRVTPCAAGERLAVLTKRLASATRPAPYLPQLGIGREITVFTAHIERTAMKADAAIA